ncbi:hypothetical protein LEP1GSC036_3216 [Leptospira weilii str. 2006001853]|uniref:Uncharacterized protein n=1 Tax=Leptospira weilii str. 2006001853 TaxID=1001589 RepID=A0A828Z0K3_9LEPT|nr:hypothetical protein LEP1GSC036_3216 [Leptospira weilii str. 2006001853]
MVPARPGYTSDATQQARLLQTQASRPVPSESAPVFSHIHSFVSSIVFFCILYPGFSLLFTLLLLIPNYLTRRSLGLRGFCTGKFISAQVSESCSIEHINKNSANSSTSASSERLRFFNIPLIRFIFCFLPSIL